MPWKVKSLMSQRREFVRLAQAEGINFSQLCKRFAISRKTGYKWLKRFESNRYEVSRRAFPQRLPELEYPAGAVVRRVNSKYISYQWCRIFVGRAFSGQDVALRPTATEGVWEVRYAHFRIGSLDLREPSAADHKVLPMSPNVCYP
jgi:transposase-like protein